MNARAAGRPMQASTLVLALSLAWPLSACVATTQAGTAAAASASGPVDQPLTPSDTDPAIAADAASAAASTSNTATANAATPAAVPRVPPAPHQPYTQREDVRSFARSLPAARGIDAAWALSQLEQARYEPAVAKLMMPPPAGTAKDWSTYRARFVEPRRIAAGVAFWRANEDALRRAEQRWGVPPWLVVGIVGVETFYGRITGNFRVIDALTTLSFDFPAGRKDRSPFFRAQLEAYLAGAIGLPQFMPGSIAQWALDFDGDGRIDLTHSPADAIGSVAHYMAAHGWQRDMPAYYDAAAPTDTRERATLLLPDILPSFTAQELQAHGAVLKSEQARRHVGPLALVELQNGSKAPPSYVAGTENFYVVTRYNWSAYYAMAVIDLGHAVQAQVQMPREQDAQAHRPLSLRR